MANRRTDWWCIDWSCNADEIWCDHVSVVVYSISHQ